MKKVFSTLLAAGFIALVACGPSEDAKNAEQATADSIAAAQAADSAAAASWTLTTTKVGGDDCSAQVNNVIAGILAQTGNPVAGSVSNTYLTGTATAAVTPSDGDTFGGDVSQAAIQTMLSNCVGITVEIKKDNTIKSFKDNLLNATQVINWGPNGGSSGSSCLAQTYITVPATPKVYFSDFTRLTKCVAMNITLPAAPTTICSTGTAGNAAACSADDTTKMSTFLKTLNATISTQCSNDVQQLVGAVLGTNVTFSDLLNLTNTAVAPATANYNPNSVLIKAGLIDPVCAGATNVCHDMLIAGTYSPAVSSYPFLANQTALTEAYKKCVNSGVGNSVMAFGAFLAMQLFF